MAFGLVHSSVVRSTSRHCHLQASAWLLYRLALVLVIGLIVWKWVNLEHSRDSNQECCIGFGNSPGSLSHFLSYSRKLGNRRSSEGLRSFKPSSGLGIWARKWDMRFQPVKCNMMQLTKKHNTIDASYTLEGTVLENVVSIKYLGVTITSDLKWNSHIRNVCSNANRTLGFLRRNLFSCPQDVKEAAYKTLVRPIVEYGSTVWDPHCNGLNDELENVQKRAARFVTRNYSYETGSMTGILEELKWETLQKRRKDNRLILMYKGLNGKARIIFSFLLKT